MKDDVVIEVEHLTKVYKIFDKPVDRIKESLNPFHLRYSTDFYALQDVSFEIRRGETIGFVGKNGAGKSTLLKILAGLHGHDGGELQMGGAAGFNPGRDVGMVFQRPNPFPMSIYDNIAYGCRVHGMNDKKMLDEIVERSLQGAALWDEVKDRLHSSAMGMSGGQQQRLCIARTLAVEPEVLLMDEPCSALDPISTMKIEELVSELKARYTIVMVTHNMQQAARVSDSTAFFLNGQLIEYDLTDAIFTKPRNKKTEDYITGRFG